jgi:hypothetical protein
MREKRNLSCKMLLSVILAGVVMTGLSSAVYGDAPGPGSKKLLSIGWDEPTPERLRLHIKEMEKSPFDGVVINVTGKTAGGEYVDTRHGSSKEKWTRAGFQKSVDDLKASQSKKLTDNFLLFGANPGNFDWFDDEAWRNIIEHWRIAAWVAREGKLKGIAFDPEAYNPPYQLFHYPSQTGFGKRSFEEYTQKVRQRGREIMQAVAKEYPDITLFCYWMNSINSLATEQSEPNRALAAMPCGLLPSLLNGWLDVAPPSVVVVDGFEETYKYNSDTEFLRAYSIVKGRSQKLVAPENRAKYRAQVQAGFGIYLDAYLNPPTNHWYVDPKGGTPVERLEANVSSAISISDQYVWIYGEQSRWWPTNDPRVKTMHWSERMPGVVEALNQAAHPQETSLAKIDDLRAAGKLKDLVLNSGFTAEEPPLANTLPTNWTTYQRDDSKGQFVWDTTVGATEKGSIRASKILDGCVLLATDVKPGERYAVAASYRQQGQGNVWMRVRWQTSAGDWINDNALDSMFYGALKEQAADKGLQEWNNLFGFVRVPEGAGKLAILLSVANQSTLQDNVWFDDAHLYPLQ